MADFRVTQDSWNCTLLISWGLNLCPPCTPTTIFPMPIAQGQRPHMHPIFLNEWVHNWMNPKMLCLCFPSFFPLSLLYLSQCPPPNKWGILTMNDFLPMGSPFSPIPQSTPEPEDENHFNNGPNGFSVGVLTFGLIFAAWRLEEGRLLGIKEGKRGYQNISQAYEVSWLSYTPYTWYVIQCLEHNFKMGTTDSILQWERSLREVPWLSQSDTVNWGRDEGETRSILILDSKAHSL